MTSWIIAWFTAHQSPAEEIYPDEYALEDSILFSVWVHPFLEGFYTSLTDSLKVYPLPWIVFICCVKEKLDCRKIINLNVY